MSVATGVVRPSGTLSSIATVPLVATQQSPATPNLEFSVPLTGSIKKILVKSRNGSLVRLSFVTGGTSSDYFLIERNNSLSLENFVTENLELFLATDKALDTVQIIYWT